jgi:hypothetical protein
MEIRSTLNVKRFDNETSVNKEFCEKRRKRFPAEIAKKGTDIVTNFFQLFIKSKIVQRKENTLIIYNESFWKLLNHSMVYDPAIKRAKDTNTIPNDINWIIICVLSNSFIIKVYHIIFILEVYNSTPCSMRIIFI